MSRMSMLRAASLAVVMVLGSIVAPAQTAQVEGTIRLKSDDNKKFVAGALIDIYRTDIKGHWSVKTDKNGHFIILGLPLAGTFLFVVSGPDVAPTWMPNVRISQMPVVDFTMDPGDGRKLTLEEVQAAMAQQKAGGGGKSGPPPDKGKMEAAQKEQEIKAQEAKDLQASFDTAVKHFNTGTELKGAGNYQGALSEFEQAAMLDITKNKNFIEVGHRSNAQIAETLYHMGADLFNKRDRDGAKPLFKKSVAAANKAVEIASTATEEPNIKNDLITYYSILSKSAQVLIENYGETALIDPTVKSLEKAEELDTANKLQWEVTRGNLFRSAGRTDEAIEVYKKVLVADPNNLDALYNMGLALLGSTEREKIQESVNLLDQFVSKAPPTDKRVSDAKATIVAIKNQFNVEAEKPEKAAPKRKRP
ncbi:MAG TPA: tetratricopeptide repeat protein [Blastocatellia bacterium]|nr:tetratricopeptide repeat protein [Blastocatellia bacterium]